MRRYGLLKCDEISLAYSRHDRQEDRRKSGRFRPRKKTLCREATEHDVGRDEVREDELAVLLERRWCLEVSLLQALRSSHEVVAIKVEPA